MKNIIFDLGNVLISWDPAGYLRGKGLSEDEQTFLVRELFGSPEWVELDRGTLTAAEAISRIAARNPAREKLIRDHSDFHPMLHPIGENTGLLEGLKKKGYRLFYLTNYHDELFDTTVAARDFFHHFEGGVVSARVKLIKPDRAIFETLLEKYGLDARETLFIDDSLKNVEAAAGLGMETIHLTEPSLLKKLLEEKLSRS